MPLERLIERASRRAASEMPRRSFLGRLGMSLAAIGAGTSVIALTATDTYATDCGCSNCGHSTSCGSSSCPSGTTPCGAWYVCGACGNGYTRRYQDCCASPCSAGCGSDGYPRCYYSAPYGSGTVKCRAVGCFAFC